MSDYVKNTGPVTGYGSSYWAGGLDVGAKKGSKLVSPITGTVKFAGPKSGWGNQVVIVGDDGTEVQLSHNDALSVKAGQRVVKYQPLGTTGNTGNVLKSDGTKPSAQELAAGRGAHVDITVRDPKGQIIPPAKVQQTLTTKDIYNLGPQFTKGVNTMRQKGKSDTEILDYLASRDYNFKLRLDDVRARGKTNDRDLLNTLAVRIGGSAPTVASNPTDEQTAAAEAAKPKPIPGATPPSQLNPVIPSNLSINEQRFIRNVTTAEPTQNTPENMARLHQVYQKIQPQRSQLLVDTASFADKNMVARLFDTQQWEKLSKYVSDSYLAQKEIDKGGFSRLMDGVNDMIGKAMDGINKIPGVNQTENAVGSTLENVVAKPISAAGQITGNIINKKPIAQNVGEAWKQGSTGVDLNTAGAVFANIDRLKSKEAADQIRATVEANGNRQGVKEWGKDISDKLIKGAVLTVVSAGIGKASPAAEKIFNAVIAIGQGKAAYDQISEGIKTNNQAMVAEGFGNLTLALISGKSLFEGGKNSFKISGAYDKSMPVSQAVEKLGLSTPKEQKYSTAVRKTIQDSSVKMSNLERNQAAAERAFKDVDMKGVKTYKESVARTKAAKSSIYGSLEETASTNKKTYTPKDLTTKVGGNNVDYVKDAIGDIITTPGATKEQVVSYEKLLQKYETTGLTANEINRVAIDHGSARSAFSKQTNEPLKSKGAMEETRTGVKTTFRSLFPEETAKKLEILDKRYSDLKTLEDRLSRQQAKVYKAQTRAMPQTVLEKTVGLIEKVANIASLGTEGYIKRVGLTILKNLRGQQSMTPLETEKFLAKYAKQIEALKGKTGKNLEVGIKKIADTESERIAKEQALLKFNQSRGFSKVGVTASIAAVGAGATAAAKMMSGNKKQENSQPAAKSQRATANPKNSNIKNQKTVTNDDVENYIGTVKSVKIDKNGMIKLTGNTLAKENNNPGNLKFAGQPNAVKGRGGFAKFKDQITGYRAVIKQVQADQKRNFTLEQFVKKYSPPKENNTKKYIAFMEDQLGIKKADKITSVNPIKIAKALVRFESQTEVTD